jgi:eukaryotic-like serine/threonine-protein kinase
MTLPTGTRLGSFEVSSPLGAGGMGEVYLAKDLRLGREVALKVLPEELSKDPSRLARFEQEARSASALNHPNIVTIYEIGREGDTPYIAMELVDGKTLRELSAGGPMTTRKILAAAAQVAEGLAKAHGAGIVHRDLKPENLMVSKDGFVKILDFGLAKLTEPESGGASAMPTLAKAETHPGTVLGTVGYMSPEQASGQSVDFRSDQFSLGSILYELVTGEKAFARKTAAETMSAIIRDEPEPLGKSRPQTPLPLRWIVERCLAKDPEERYASTRDLARDLAGVRDHVSEIGSGGEALVAAPGRPRRLRAAVPAVLVAAALAAGWIAARVLTKQSAAPSFHRLTFRTGTIANARFAPDGRTVIYGAKWEGDSTPHDISLYQTRAESPESRRFDYPDADILSVSRDGEMALLFGEGKAVSTLSRVALAGGASRPVLEGARYAGADWAPNGRDLAVIRRVAGKDRLEAPIGTVLLESETSLRSPRFSPAGDWIALFEGPDTRISVSLVETASRRRRVLSDGWWSASGVPCWAPGGKEIWFTASRSGTDPEALYAMSLSGRERLITRAPGNLELDDISAEGRVLAAHHRLLVVLMGRTRGESSDRNLSWFDWSNPTDLSADGKTLVFTEAGEGGGQQQAVYIRDTDGSPAVRLGEGTSGSLSPDGKWVTARVNGGPGSPPRLILLPTGAGDPKTVPTDGLDFDGAGNWLPDGRRLVLGGAEKGRPARVFVVEIEGGGRRPVTPEGISSFRFPYPGNPVSPDGARFLATDANGIRFVGFTDGAVPRRLAELPPRENLVQWSADGRSVIVRAAGVPIKLALFDTLTGERRPWKEILPGSSPTLGLRLFLMSRDGETYVYQTFGALSDLYLIDGLK